MKDERTNIVITSGADDHLRHDGWLGEVEIDISECAVDEDAKSAATAAIMKHLLASEVKLPNALAVSDYIEEHEARLISRRYAVYKKNG